LEEYPNLKTAYELKEAFFRMYDCTSRLEAEQYYEEWQRSIPKELAGFRMICSTVRRSRHEIFNYFDAPYTNAFVEVLNRSIRFIADQGCGYDFEVLRGKVLLTAGRKNTFYE
ncbi:MAG: transposase, partial [Anaerorhabdus sp.]|uniref:transposase n=1 Tax=Anaerorhabdus sp. TaxID=1872524 RepID=UPI003A8AF424